MVITWAITSAADQQPFRGGVFQRSAGMASAARKSLSCATASFSRMGSSEGMTLPEEILKPEFEDQPYRVAPPASSKACANCRTRPSPNGGPKICKPTGSFPPIFPQGTEIPGTPASDPVTV